jgi:hypothetical protein
MDIRIYRHTSRQTQTTQLASNIILKKNWQKLGPERNCLTWDIRTVGSKENGQTNKWIDRQADTINRPFLKFNFLQISAKIGPGKKRRNWNVSCRSSSPGRFSSGAPRRSRSRRKKIFKTFLEPPMTSLTLACCVKRPQLTFSWV